MATSIPWNETTRGDLVRRSLDAAIAAMSRNRSLLFTLNLLCALVLITIYMERNSLDQAQRENHLIAIENIVSGLRQAGLPDSVIRGGNADRIDEWTLAFLAGPCPKLSNAQIPDTRWKARVSKELFRLRRLRNDLAQVRLPSESNLPFGVSVPRNDLIPITGILMVVLYMWLVFSFRQLAAIIRKMKRLLIDHPYAPGHDPETPEQKNLREAERSLATTMFRDIIELHFMFRTSKRGTARYLVKGLYYASPAAFTLAVANDLYSVRAQSGDWGEVLQSLTTGRMMVEIGVLVVLILAAHQLTRADKAVNVASFGKAMIDAG